MTFTRCFNGNAVMVTAMLILAAMAVDGHAGKMKKSRAQKSLLETIVAKYEIVQGDASVGSETVTQEVWGDNSVVYKSVIEMSLTEGVRWDQTTELVLDEESYFPRSYQMTKLMAHGGQEVEQSASVKMVANVAVMSNRISESETRQNVVVPAGTSFDEAGVMHLVYQLLFWYDDQAGGRQTFTLLDTSRGRTSDVVMRKGVRETIELDGRQVEVDVYTVESTSMQKRYFVDDDGRVVRADFGYLVYSLSEWTRSDGREG